MRATCLLMLGLTLVGCRERADAQAPTPRDAPARAPLEASLTSAAISAEAGGDAGADVAHGVESVSAMAAVSMPTAAPEAARAEAIVLAAGGDVSFGRECGQAVLSDPAYDPFAQLGPAWSSADLRFVNLESQLSDQGGVTQSPLHRLIFTGPPGGADVLAHAGISVVSTANNHAWDYGKSALLETIDNLERARVAFAGTGRDPTQAYRPALLSARGVRVAVFAVTAVWNQPPFDAHEGRNFVAWADAERLAQAVAKAKTEADFVLLSYHGGEEYIDAPVDRTRRFVQAALALGVDAVIGHHPHVLQGVGFSDGRPILYSLGNFVFAGHDDRPWTKQSVFARLTLRPGAGVELSLCPYAIDGHRPRSLDPAGEASRIERIRQHLIGASTSTGGADVARPDALGCLRVTPRRSR